MGGGHEKGHEKGFGRVFSFPVFFLVVSKWMSRTSVVCCLPSFRCARLQSSVGTQGQFLCLFCFYFQCFLTWRTISTSSSRLGAILLFSKSWWRLELNPAQMVFLRVLQLVSYQLKFPILDVALKVAVHFCEKNLVYFNERW